MGYNLLIAISSFIILGCGDEYTELKNEDKGVVNCIDSVYSDGHLYKF